MKICTYVEAHREEWGVALFVIPASFVVLLVAGVAGWISTLLG